MNGFRFAILAVLLQGSLLSSGIHVTAQQTAPEPPVNPAIVALIGKLAEVADADMGYSPYTSGSSFAPLSGTTRVGGQLLSPSKPAVPSDVLRELVRLGPAAVPDLVRHLDDKRPTRLTVRHTFGGCGAFIINARDEDDEPHAYTLKVGDLCYVALGQIVNRPFTAACYQPTAFIIVFTPTRDPETRAKLRKEWGALTPQQHRASLLKDCEGKGKVETRVGAFVRLGYYYPEALEAPALQFLARPCCAYDDWSDFVRKLYWTADAHKRRDLFDAQVKQHGQVARDGIQQVLFSDLDVLEAREQKRLSSPLPLKDLGDEPRVLLIELFGAPMEVKAKDRPETISTYDAAEVIGYGLIYDRSVKIDRAVRAILAKTQDDWVERACMTRLVGRGYDAEIEAHYRRRERVIHESFQQYFKAILAKAGWTPLHVAVWRGERERLAELLCAGADVNAAGKDGRTPLHVAAVEGNAHAVPVLVTAGADQAARDKEGRTPVGAASFAGDTAMVRILVKAGSPIPNILVAATAGNAEEVARFLRTDKAVQRAKDSQGMTPLHRSALEGHSAVIKQLLDNGFKIDSPDTDGLTPLHYAAAMGRENACRLLIQGSAKVDSAVPRSGAQSIHLAAGNGKVQVVRLLVENGAKVDAHDAIQSTPLQYAARQGHLSVVTWLVSQKAEINARNKDGWSARSLAVREGHKEVAAFLLKNGAERSILEDLYP